MNAALHLVNITRDRKINVLMLEAQDDCSGLITDLSYVFHVLGLAAKYQNLRDGFTEDVHLCENAITRLDTEVHIFGKTIPQVLVLGGKP